MTKSECLKASAAVVRGAGFRSFAELYELVIWRGYRAEDGRSLFHWRKIERAFHTAQMLRWAADERGQARAYWVGVAVKRLSPMSIEQWRALPDALKAAA